MCGVVALLSPPDVAIDPASLRSLTARLHHRGPDGSGTWLGEGIGLGHTRLSIIDVSPAGAQPMMSADGRWVISFNGEIYNHLDLRADLEVSWRGHSDSETLANAIAKWGFVAAVKRCIGMFAICAWDREGRQLYLARDRMGEKPLYYGRVNGQFRAASELKALATSGDRLKIDTASLGTYFRHNYIPAPHTIWKGIFKLAPGHVLQVDQRNLNNLAASQPYWEIDQFLEEEPFSGSDQEAIDELQRLIRQSVGRQMVADVPLGAFLSGGIDSSTIVSVMQELSPKKVRTFTIGFEDKEYNEADRAEKIAKYLGTDHTTLVVTPSAALDTVCDFPEIWDEPFSDSSQIPTLLLSRLTRKWVTVSLSGDGGDELFAGYRSYDKFMQIWGLHQRIPGPLRRLMAKGSLGLSAVPWGRVANFLPAKSGHQIRKLANRLEIAGTIFSTEHPDEVYRRMVSHWTQPSEVVGGSYEAATPFMNLRSRGPDYGVSRLQYLDQHAYLPGDILTKVDRAAMSIGLETRIPLLDPNIVSYSWRLPMSLKVREGKGKWVLREVLSRYVPRELYEAPKKGFSVPVGEWLRGPLRDWAEALIAREKLEAQGYLRPEVIRRAWTLHTSGERELGGPLWSVFMFQAWYDNLEQANLNLIHNRIRKVSKYPSNVGGV